MITKLEVRRCKRVVISHYVQAGSCGQPAWPTEYCEEHRKEAVLLVEERLRKLRSEIALFERQLAELTGAEVQEALLAAGSLGGSA